jgi:hypothetical protein
MLEVGVKVKYDHDEWHVAGLNTISGDVYLEKGARGEERGPVYARTVVAEHADRIEPLEEEGVFSRKGLDLDA